MPSLLEDKGLSSLGTYTTMTLDSFSQFPGIVFAMWVSSRHGRMLPLQLSFVVMAISLAVFAFADTYVQIILCTCFASCSLEFGYAIFNVYSPEVFPTDIRATAIGFVFAMGSLAAIVVPYVTAFLITEATTLYAIIFFSSACAIVGYTSGMLSHQETLDRDLTDRASQLSPQSGSSSEKADAELPKAQ